MSIKSQKSLHEECSEIIERSYSVKSASDESLSCSDDDDYLAVELLHKLSPPALAALRRRFHSGGRPSDVDRRVEAVMRAAAAEEGIEFATSAPAKPDYSWIDEQGLVAALKEIFGEHKYRTHAHHLFQLLDPFQSGRASWSRLVDKMVQYGARHTRSRQEEWEEAKVTRIKKLPHCKRDTIVKLVPMQHEGTFCYVAVSRGGATGVYSGGFQLLTSYQVFYHRVGNRGRVKNCWVTDAIYMSDVQVMVYSSSERSLSLYDARTPTHTLMYRILQLPALPTCLAYTPSEYSGESELAVGTDRGGIYRLRWLQPRISLLYSNATENTQNYAWSDLRSSTQSPYCVVYSIRGGSRACARLQYVKFGEYLLSCSRGDSRSVVVTPLIASANGYVYKVPKGVSTFHCVPSLPLLAATSGDCLLIWRSVPPAPYSTIRCRNKLVDVVVNCRVRIIMALTVDCTLHIWDLDEEVLLQSVRLKFPFLGVLGRRVEFGTYCIHPGPAVAPQTLSPTTSQHSSGEELPRHWSNRILEDDPEYLKFSPPSVVISCCSYISVVCLSRSQSAQFSRSHAMLPPPEPALPARTPAGWGNEWAFPPPLSSPQISPRPSYAVLGNKPPSVIHTTAHDLTTVAKDSRDEDQIDTDLDSLLKKAGLEGILEKDFVLMQGLKHDLNQKLAEMRESMKIQHVISRAPHLSLSLLPGVSAYTVAPRAAYDETNAELLRKLQYVTSLFPGASVTVTPAPSERSTPRNT